MTSGGSRNRSGPKADETSTRSDQRGYSLTALPAKYSGEIPDFPLPEPTPREIAVWREKWSGPHGAAWSRPSEQWRWTTVALWVRTFVRCESPDAPASLLGQLHRFADQSGLTTAGLAEMGWKVAVDETAERRETKSKTGTERASSSRDRMKIVRTDGA